MNAKEITGHQVALASDWRPGIAGNVPLPPKWRPKRQE